MTIWIQSDVFWIMKWARNISKDDEQYISEVTTWRSIGKLHGQLFDTCQNKEKTEIKDNMLSKGGRKT